MKYVVLIFSGVLILAAAVLMFVNIPTQLYLLERNLSDKLGLSSSAVFPIVALLAPGIVLVASMLVGLWWRWTLPRTVLIALVGLVLVNLLALPSSLIGSII